MGLRPLEIFSARGSNSYGDFLGPSQLQVRSCGTTSYTVLRSPIGTAGRVGAKASEGRARSGRFKCDILFQQCREKVETGAEPERVLINV